MFSNTSYSAASAAAAGLGPTATASRDRSESTTFRVQAMTFLPLAWVWSAGAFRPSRRQGATDGLHAALDPVSQPEEGARRLGRAEVAVAVAVVGLLHELARVPCALDDVCELLLMGERHVRVERRVEGQDGSLQLSFGLVVGLEVVEGLLASLEPVDTGIESGVEGLEPRARVGRAPVLEGRGAARSLQQIIRPQNVVAEHPEDRVDQGPIVEVA